MSNGLPRRPARTSQRPSDVPRGSFLNLVKLPRGEGREVRLGVSLREGSDPMFSVDAFAAGERTYRIELYESDIEDLEKAIQAFRNTCRTARPK